MGTLHGLHLPEQPHADLRQPVRRTQRLLLLLFLYAQLPPNAQRIYDRFGSLADIFTNSSLMSAFGLRFQPVDATLYRKTIVP